LFEAETNGLVNRQVGYSRESNEVKRYVQDVVKANGKLVWEAIGKKSGAIFVCGKAEMADSVKKSLLEIFEANLKGETATNFMEKLKIACRYEEEIFGSSAA
jgi:sulfite reductase alpha subunit-like flavoprotein